MRIPRIVPTLGFLLLAVPTTSSATFLTLNGSTVTSPLPGQNLFISTLSAGGFSLTNATVTESQSASQVLVTFTGTLVNLNSLTSPFDLKFGSNPGDFSSTSFAQYLNDVTVNASATDGTGKPVSGVDTSSIVFSVTGTFRNNSTLGPTGLMFSGDTSGTNSFVGEVSTVAPCGFAGAEGACFPTNTADISGTIGRGLGLGFPVSASQKATVPEPTTLILLASGLGGLVLFRGKRRFTRGA